MAQWFAVWNRGRIHRAYLQPARTSAGVLTDHHLLHAVRLALIPNYPEVALPRSIFWCQLQWRREDNHAWSKVNIHGKLCSVFCPEP